MSVTVETSGKDHGEPVVPFDQGSSGDGGESGRGRRWSWKTRLLAGGLAVMATAAVFGPRVKRWVDRERREDRQALVYFETLDQNRIRDEHAGKIKIQLIENVAVFREGVEIRENCTTKNRDGFLKPGDNLVDRVPAGQVLMVPLPVRKSDEDGTFWERFSMASTSPDSPSETQPFSAEEVAAKNVCVDVSKYAGQRTPGGLPMIELLLTNPNSPNATYTTGKMSNNGFIAVDGLPGIAAAQGHLLPAGSEKLYTQVAEIAQSLKARS